MKVGFQPVYNIDSKILILGSFPSVKSLAEGFYYGNKQNRFWKLLAEIYNQDMPISIDEKKEFILKNHLALWDTLELCDIKGSSDSDITLSNSSPVNLMSLLEKTHIEKIICNGKKSYELFGIHFSNCGINAICLPSTSPANARFDKEKWRKELQNN